MRKVTTILLALLISILFFVSCENNVEDDSTSDNNNEDIIVDDDTETKNDEIESDSQTEQRDPNTASSMTIADSHELTDALNIPAIGESITFNTPVVLFKYITGEEFLITKITREAGYIVFTTTDSTKDFFSINDKWDKLSFGLRLSDGTTFTDLLTLKQINKIIKRNPEDIYYGSIQKRITENDYVAMLCDPNDTNDSAMISTVEYIIKGYLSQSDKTFDETKNYYNMYYIKQSDAKLFGMEFQYRN